MVWWIPWARGGCSQPCGSSWHQGELAQQVLLKERWSRVRGIFPQTLTRTPTPLLLWSMMPVWMFALNPPWGSPESRKKTYRDQRLRKEKICSSQSHSGVSNKIHSLIRPLVRSFIHSFMMQQIETEDPLCARHCSRSRGPYKEQTDEVPAFRKLMVGQG